MSSKIVISIYADPFGYPPTLNAAKTLANIGETVTVVGRDFCLGSPDSDKNIEFLLLSDENSLKSSALRKVKSILRFFEFIRIIWKVSKDNTKILLCFDNVALLAGYLVLLTGRKTTFWYHSHDHLHTNKLKSNSLLWIAKKWEKRIFKRVNFFSLPVFERLVYYNVPEDLKNMTFVIPNYPRINSSYDASPRCLNDGVLKILFQGNINESHGFERIIPVLQNKIFGRKIELTLLGPIKQDYQSYLEGLAVAVGCEFHLKILPPVSYQDLANITTGYDIGLATHLPGDKVIYSLGATASNKIYEYAYAGLPVLLYDTDHYKKYLGSRKWTNFTDLSENSILSCLHSIVENYAEQSASAIKDIKSELNYELYFNNVYLNEISRTNKI